MHGCTALQLHTCAKDSTAGHSGKSNGWGPLGAVLNVNARKMSESHPTYPTWLGNTGNARCLPTCGSSWLPVDIHLFRRWKMLLTFHRWTKKSSCIFQRWPEQIDISAFTCVCCATVSVISDIHKAKQPNHRKALLSCLKVSTYVDHCCATHLGAQWPWVLCKCSATYLWSGRDYFKICLQDLWSLKYFDVPCDFLIFESWHVPSPSHAGLRWHGSGCSACRSRLKQKGHATTNLISLWSLANKRGVFRVRGLQLCLPIDRIFSAFLDLTFAVSKSSFLLCDPNLACEKVLQFTICSVTVVISVERIKL